MHFRIEILEKTVNPISCEIVEAWKPVRPSNGFPYEFKTEREAEAILNICYPKGSPVRSMNRARVVEYNN